MRPLISVIIPCYNQGQFLSQALNSIFQQYYQNWECLIVDDGSTDKTEKISKDWCSKDNRFQYFQKKNGGLSSARNFGLSRSKGEFIQFLDADDFLDFEKFQISINALSEGLKGKRYIAITDFLMFVDETKKYQPPYCKLSKDLFTYESFLFQWDESFSIPIHCGLFNKKLFNSFSFPEDLKAKEDWIMWIFILLNEPDFFYIDKPLAFYRKHKNSMTMSEGVFEEHMRSLEYLKQQIDTGDYEKLLEVMVKRYYKASLRFKTELNEVQGNKFYRLHLFLLKVKKKLKLT